MDSKEVEKKLVTICGNVYDTKITRLSLNGAELKEIPEEIKYLPNLKFLTLENNQIQDIAPLKDLHNLEELWLISNQIQDISSLLPLKHLHNLQHFDMCFNPIKNPFEFKFERPNQIEELKIWFRFLDNCNAIKIQTCYRKWKYRKAIDRYLYPVLNNLVLQYLI